MLAPGRKAAFKKLVIPGSDRNPIHCKHDDQTIPVAILSTDDFDARTVDHTTVRFGKTGVEAQEGHTDKKTGEPKRHEEDVDGDGDVDLVFHFRLGDTGLACSDTEARLTARTFDGRTLGGVDYIDVVASDGEHEKNHDHDKHFRVDRVFTLLSDVADAANPGETSSKYGIGWRPALSGLEGVHLLALLSGLAGPRTDPYVNASTASSPVVPADDEADKPRIENQRRLEQVLLAWPPVDDWEARDQIFADLDESLGEPLLVDGISIDFQDFSESMIEQGPM